MKKTMKKCLAVLAALSLSAALLAGCGGKSAPETQKPAESAETSGEAAETDYPKGSIKVVCSWAAGGQADTVCRIMTDRLSTELGVPVVVENITGNGGQVAAIEYMQAEADGYTLLYTSDVVQYLAPRVASVQYDPAQMVPLCTTASNGFGLIVNTDTGATNLEEFKAYADQAGTITVGVTGKTGAITYELLNALFQDMGVNAEFMVFDNGPAVALEVVGKHIDCGIAIDPQCDQYVLDGSVNYIASFLEEGHPIEGADTVPSMVSQGYDITCANPNMIVAKAGTDQAILDKLTAALQNCQGDFEAKCEELGYTPNVTFGDELTSYLADLDALYAGMAAGK